MRVQQMMDYLKVYFPNMLNNETVENTELLTMLADMYNMGFNNGYDSGHKIGYQLGFNEGYSKATDEWGP